MDDSVESDVEYPYIDKVSFVNDEYSTNTDQWMKKNLDCHNSIMRMNKALGKYGRRSRVMLMFRAIECSNCLTLHEKLEDVNKQYLVGMGKTTRKAINEYIEYVIQQHEKALWITSDAE